MKKIKNGKYIGCFVILVVVCALMIRAFFSFCWSDESFYLAVTHRFYIGQKPLVDEWWPTQFYAAFLLPFYRLYYVLVGSNEGVFLGARILSIFFSALTAEFIYLVLVKYLNVKMTFATVAGILILLYSRANISGVSYYNFYFCSFASAVFSFIICITAMENKEKKKSYLWGGISGILMGMAIITVPTTLIFYIPLIVFLLCFLKKTRNNQAIIVWVICTGMIGIGYVLWLHSKITIGELLNSIDHLFAGDAYKAKTLKAYVERICELVFYSSKFILPIMGLVSAIQIFLHLFKKEMSDLLRFLLTVGTSVISIYQMRTCASSHMVIYISFSMWGMVLLLIHIDRIKIWSQLKRKWMLFMVIWAGVAIFSWLLASATSDPMTAGFALLAIPTIICMEEIIANYDGYTKIVVIIAVGFVIAYMLFTTTRIRVESVYRDAPLSMLDTKIESGPAKGLITTKEHVQQYEACIETIQIIQSLPHKENDSIFISALAPWMYLCFEMDYGMPHSWRMLIDDPSFEIYYKEHDIDNLKYILIMDERYGNTIQAGNPEGTVDNPNRNVKEGWLYEIMKNEYTCMDVPCGTLYTRK